MDMAAWTVCSVILICPCDLLTYMYILWTPGMIHNSYRLTFLYRVLRAAFKRQLHDFCAELDSQLHSRCHQEELTCTYICNSAAHFTQEYLRTLFTGQGSKRLTSIHRDIV